MQFQANGKCLPQIWFLLSLQQLTCPAWFPTESRTQRCWICLLLLGRVSLHGEFQGKVSSSSELSEPMWCFISNMSFHAGAQVKLGQPAACLPRIEAYRFLCVRVHECVCPILEKVTVGGLRWVHRELLGQMVQLHVHSLPKFLPCDAAAAAEEQTGWVSLQDEKEEFGFIPFLSLL
uniref:Uncharacterized protein n=1 Tax=Sphaerodactylus townsendi TaxID=933632 RepID=A0ACB8ELN3_9SAUR